MIDPALEAPEPGTPARARLVGWLVVLLVVIAAAVQQVGIAEPPPPVDDGAIAAPEADFEMTCRLAVKFKHAGRENPQLAGALESAARIEKDLEKALDRPEDRLRLAMVRAEVEGSGAGLAALDALDAQLPEGSPLAQDAEAVRGILAGAAPTEEQSAGLRERHGWFGRLALVLGADDIDPARQAVVSGGLELLVVVGGFFGIAACAMLAGFVLFILGLVKWSSGTLRLRFTPLPPRGSALIETVAVFILGFLALKAIGLVAHFVAPAAGAPLQLGLQWLLLLVVLWPVFRGMPRPAAMHALGLHRGRGVLREIGAGIVGYVACLPLLLAGMISMLVLKLADTIIRERLGQAPQRTNNTVLELAGGEAGPWAIVLLFALATLWAPVVEEVVFRGALYGHLRKRWRVLASALVVAPAFALMHGYPLILMGGVVSLGLGFCLVREWRGSLIAPMVGHCLNNAAMLTFVVLLLRTLD